MAAKNQTQSSQPPAGVTPEAYTNVENGAISALLDKHRAEIAQLPGFKSPESRDEAIALLVQANIRPAQPRGEAGPPTAQAAPVEAAKETLKFKIVTPNPAFAGERSGVTFRDGRGYTDDAIKAHACLEHGYEVINQETGEPAWPKDEVPDASQDDGVRTAAN